MDYNNEVPKHRKKKVNKIPKKADHKHNYIEAIGRTHSNFNPSEYSYMPCFKCTICGKTKLGKFFFTSKSSYNNMNCILTRLEDIQEKYPDLEIVDL